MVKLGVMLKFAYCATNVRASSVTFFYKLYMGNMTWPGKKKNQSDFICFNPCFYAEEPKFSNNLNV